VLADASGLVTVDIPALIRDPARPELVGVLVADLVVAFVARLAVRPRVADIEGLFRNSPTALDGADAHERFTAT
jgi:hypothetical protein